MLNIHRIKKQLFALICACILCTVYRPSPGMAAENTLILPDIQVSGHDISSFGIALDNSQLVRGVQIGLKFDSSIGFMISDVSLTARTAGYEQPSVNITLNEIGEAVVNIVLFSLNGAAIIPGDGDIVSVHYRTSFDVVGESPLLFQESVLSDLAFRPVLVSFEHGRVTANRIVESYQAFAESQRAVPEASTLICWLLGLLALPIIMRRRR